MTEFWSWFTRVRFSFADVMIIGLLAGATQAFIQAF